MNPDSLIVARPHFRQLQNDLYFFLSDRVYHSLCPGEARIWQELQDGPRALKDLGDDAAVQSLAKSKTIEVIEPTAKTNRPRILVIEPHSDDAALSIGATMWKMRNEVEFDLITMASRSNYTSAFHLRRDCFNRSDITHMRTVEGELFVRHLGGHYHCAGMPEATLRYQDSDWSLDFFRSHEVPVAISNNRRGQPELLRAWTARLKEFLNGKVYEELWLPLGAGTHSDHDLARNAALEAVVDIQTSTVIRLFEDVPYGGNFPDHSDRILRALRMAGADLVPWHQDVTEFLDRKLDLLTIFASQFKVSAVERGVKRSAAGDSSERIVERFWIVTKLPDELPKDEIWFGASGVAETASKLREFSRKSKNAKRVAIFAISASGRWSDDARSLKILFPAAKFVVYAGPKICAEFEAVADNKTELNCIDGRPESWMKAALREAATSHRIVISGDAIRNARLLTKVWPLGRKIVVQEMDHLIQAIEKRST